MFVLPAIATLFTYVYVRPHELFEGARFLNVNLVIALVALGLVLDVKVGAARLRGSPLLTAMLLLFGWALFTTALKAPDRLSEQWVRLAVPAAAFIGISEGLQSLRGLATAAALLVAITLVLAGAGVHQGQAPMTCFVVGGEKTPMGVFDAPDGRPCTKIADCKREELRDRDYACERPGVLWTHSIGGRVRFRGLLEDPNVLSWAIAMGVPLAFGFWERRRTALRLLVLATLLGLSIACVIMTQSRSGQISLVAMMGVYFVRRFGWRGAGVGLLVALPALLLGGRSGEEAESSSQERLKCWAEAMDMWRENPLTGVGSGQFLEHYVQTAHSSFLLSLAELGPLGLFLWSVALYVAIKIPIRVQVDLAGRPDAASARSWATALLASQVGLLVSVFFLTLTYHAVLWIFLGLAGALYAAVRLHQPDFRVRVGLRDLMLVGAVDAVLVASTFIYLRVKGM